MEPSNKGWEFEASWKRTGRNTKYFFHIDVFLVKIRPVYLLHFHSIIIGTIGNGDAENNNCAVTGDRV